MVKAGRQRKHQLTWKKKIARPRLGALDPEKRSSLWAPPVAALLWLPMAWRLWDAVGFDGIPVIAAAAAIPATAIVPAVAWLGASTRRTQIPDRSSKPRSVRCRPRPTQSWRSMARNRRTRLPMPACRTSPTGSMR